VNGRVMSVGAKPPGRALGHTSADAAREPGRKAQLFPESRQIPRNTATRARAKAGAQQSPLWRGGKPRGWSQRCSSGAKPGSQQHACWAPEGRRTCASKLARGHPAQRTPRRRPRSQRSRIPVRCAQPPRRRNSGVCRDVGTGRGECVTGAARRRQAFHERGAIGAPRRAGGAACAPRREGVGRLLLTPSRQPSKRLRKEQHEHHNA
jgi:hypothetical protein